MFWHIAVNSGLDLCRVSGHFNGGSLSASNPVKFPTGWGNVWLEKDQTPEPCCWEAAWQGTRGSNGDPDGWLVMLSALRVTPQFPLVSLPAWHVWLMFSSRVCRWLSSPEQMAGVSSEWFWSICGMDLVWSTSELAAIFNPLRSTITNLWWALAGSWGARSQMCV